MSRSFDTVGGAGAAPATPTPHTLSPEAYARVGIVGFGAVGAAILAQQVTIIEHQIRDNPGQPLPLVEFKIYNMGGDHAHGPAYDLKRMLFSLNFPAQAEADEYNVPTGETPESMGMVGMHLLDGSRSDLLDWLEAEKRALIDLEKAQARRIYQKAIENGLTDSQIAYRYPKEYRAYHLSCGGDDEWGAHTYLPRAMYREYLLGIFARTASHVKAINGVCGAEVIKLDFPPVDGRVTRIEHTSEGTMSIRCEEIKDADPSIITEEVDSVVVATGHHYGPLFSKEVQDQPTFANTPMDDTEIEDALKIAGALDDPDSTVLIIGTGASYLDALRNLEALGYKGKIVAVSSSPLDYWPFDPRKNKRPYDLSAFLQDTEKAGLAEIQDRLVQEVHCAAAVQGGPQNLFSALKGHMGAFESSLNAADFAEFKDFVSRLGGNRTAPQSYEVFCRLRDSGQLQFVSARMKSTSYNAKTGLWETDLGQAQPFTSSILIDCAGLATRVVGRRGEIPDPLIRSMVEDTRVAVADTEKGTVACAPANTDQIAFAGVAGTNDRGIPFTRQLFRTASAPTLLKAQEMAAQRCSVIGIARPALEA